MKDFLTTTRRGVAALLLAVLATAPGCELFEAENPIDPNGPDILDILETATQSQMANLAIGTEAQARVDLHLYLIDVGVIGREYWRFSSADPRFTGDLLGQAGQLDNNSFFTTRPWGARYRAIRNACTLLKTLDVTTAPLSDAQKTAARGFANTWIAHQLLMNSNLTYENGVRIDVCDLEREGDAPLVVGRQAVLDQLASMLDAAYADLGGQAGEDFFFPTTVAVGDEDSAVNGFRNFNRALAARVDAYRKDWQGTLDALGESFIDAGADLGFGAYHIFSTGSGDLTNPFFVDPQNPAGDAVIVHPSFISDSTGGDSRVGEKVALRVNDDGNPNPATLDDLSGSYGFAVYDGPTAPIPVIRNAELLLLRAEANLQLGNVDAAKDDLNVIRNAAGLDDYDDAAAGARSPIDEMLYQRRYELYGEGHRWIDVRRYDRLNTLPLDRPGDEVFRQFPIPANENIGG